MERILEHSHPKLEIQSLSTHPCGNGKLGGVLQFTKNISEASQQNSILKKKDMVDMDLF